MAEPVLWLAVYLSIGVVALCACYNRGACLVRARLERNRRILAGFLPSGPSAGEPPAAQEPPGRAAGRR